MKSNKMSYPHPVMGHLDDYKNLCRISKSILQEQDDYYHIECELEHDNKLINELIKKGQFCYVCEINNKLTFQRWTEKQNSPHFDIKLERTKLRDVVSLNFYIIANEKVLNYENPSFHKDYKGFKFDFNPGDTIAYFGGKKFDADIQYQKISGISAFMAIVDGGEIDMPLYRLDDDMIKIHLPTPLFLEYRKSTVSQNKCFSGIIHSSIVFNALLYALQNYSENTSKAWAKTLKYRVVWYSLFLDNFVFL